MIDILQHIDSLTDEQVKKLYNERFGQKSVKKKKIKYDPFVLTFGDFTPSGNVWHTDGYMIQNNPSPIGGGVTAFKNGKLFHTSKIFKKGITNNETELRACLYAILASEPGDEIIVDSTNTISWIRKGKTKARPDLIEYIEVARKFAKEKGIKITWKRRDENLAGIYNESKGY